MRTKEKREIERETVLFRLFHGAAGAFRLPLTPGLAATGASLLVNEALIA